MSEQSHAKASGVSKASAAIAPAIQRALPDLADVPSVGSSRAAVKIAPRGYVAATWARLRQDRVSMAALGLLLAIVAD